MIMNLSKQFILLNGEPKTLQIDNIEKNGANGYSVRFKNNAKSYNYGYDKVTWLTDPEWFDPTHCQVFIDNIQQQNIREIWYRRLQARSIFRTSRSPTSGVIHTVGICGKPQQSVSVVIIRSQSRLSSFPAESEDNTDRICTPGTLSSTFIPIIFAENRLPVPMITALTCFFARIIAPPARRVKNAVSCSEGIWLTYCRLQHLYLQQAPYLR